MKKIFFRLIATFICIGSLSAMVPFQRNERLQVQAEATKLTSRIGYSVNVTSLSYDGVYTTIFSGDFINSGAMKVIEKSEKHEDLQSLVYGSYEELAKNYSDMLKRDALVDDDGLFFMGELDSRFGDSLQDSKYATQLLCYQRYYSVEYSLILQNEAVFAFTYADKLDSGFLVALDKLQAGKLGYFEFFDKFGTHVITGVDFGVLKELYCGYFYPSNFLSESEWSELSGKVVDGISVGSDGKLREPSSLITSKYGTNVKKSYSTMKGSADKPEEIGFSHLVPLYDAIPEEYASLKALMKSQFQYYLSYNAKLYKYSLLPKLVGPYENNGNPNGRVEPILIGIGVGVGVVAVAVVCVLLIRKKKKKS